MAGADRFAFLKNATRLVSRDDRPNAAGEFRRVSLYRTNMKYPLVRVEETLQRLPSGQEVVLESHAAAADHVVVRAQPGETEADVAALAKQNGDALLKPMHSPGYYLVQLPGPNLDAVPIAVQNLGQPSQVLRYAEADQIAQTNAIPNDPSFSQEWSLNNTGQTGGAAHADINAELAWSVISSSPNIVVAVIDTGIDFNHPDLAANIWTNPHPGSLSGFSNDLHGWNFCNETATPQDDNCHGTHVSGTIGAVGNNSVGVSGVTWSVKIMPLKFLDSTGSGYTSDAVDAVTYARAMGARIMSNSWGGVEYSQALKDAIDAANNANILFVVAAGNDGTNNDTSPTYPASFTSANIVVVAATDNTDHLASFSNFGSSSVQLAAPGVGIYSTLPVTRTSAMISEGLSANYGQLSGTSMATPHVSGAAALALAQNPALTVAQLKAQLIQRTDSLAQLAGIVQSAGRLDLYNVVNTNWSPGAPVIVVQQTTFDDKEGDGDGAANPGEIIHLTPVLYNSGTTAATNVTVQMVSQQATATVLSSSYSTGALASQQTLTLPTPFRIQLSNTISVGTTLNFDLITQATGGNAIHTPVTVLVQAKRGYATAPANFKCGEIKADPSRNLVYATDLTNNRILAINTDSGNVAAVSTLDATTGAGQIAVSVDDSKLYVSLPTAQKIQVFSLPSLSPLGSLPVSFSPGSLACSAGGQLYAGSVATNWAILYEVNASNGEIIQTINTQYYAPLLRTNQAGTKLFVEQTGVEGGGGTLFSYDISGPTAIPADQWNSTEENINDFALDEANNRVYVMNGGIAGVNVIDLTTNEDSTVWPLGSSFAEAVAFLPGGTSVFGASGDPYNDAKVVEFDRTSGTPLRTYAVGSYTLTVQTRGIAITPNGNVLYVLSPSEGGLATFGLIGGNTLNVTNPSSASGSASPVISQIAFGDTLGNNDASPNAGEIIDLTPTITNEGSQATTNVSVGIVCDSHGSVVSNATQNIATLGAGQSLPTPGSFRVQLAPNLAIGSNVQVTFTVTPQSGPSQTLVYSLVILPPQNVTTVSASMQLGEMLADQQRDIVYMVDKTDKLLLALDTDAGHIVNTAPLGGDQSLNWGGQRSGMMAESVDGTHLFLALPQSNVIQEFSLPSLTSVAQWTYNFQPVSLACDAMGRLYCATSDPAQKLVQIDGTTGAVLSQTGAGFWCPLNLFGTGTVLKRNAAGTELYASLATTDGLPCQLFRFSSNGAGAPTQLNAFALSGACIDYVVDEPRSAFYAIPGNSEVTDIPFNGSATSWSLDGGVGGGNAITLLPGASNVLAAFSSPSQTIQVFSPTSGQVVSSYALTTGGYSLRARGMVTTPNGRTVYVTTALASSNPSVDSYTYQVALIGGTLDMQIPAATPIGLQSLVVTDPAPGSNDGFVHAGQNIQLATTFKNFLNSQITATSIQLSLVDSLATVKSPSIQTIGTVNSFATFSPASNFNITVNVAATDAHAIPLNFIISYNNGSHLTIPYTLYVSAPLRAEIPAQFLVGDLLSDPTRDQAYVVDNTNQRLLAVNTDTGTVTKSINLSNPPNGSHLALSSDASHLYVAINGYHQIQVISLPDMEQSDIINLDFNPYSLASGVDGKIYASSCDLGNQYLRQIDPVSGETLGTFGTQPYAPNSILRTSLDHTKLYAAQVSGVGTNAIDAYNINATGLPTVATGYPFVTYGMYDFGVDNAYSHIYSVPDGYGIAVTDMIKGLTANWNTNSNYITHGEAVSFLPSGAFVYGASAGSIRRFNRLDGTPLADYPLLDQTYQIKPGGMAITANGHILYSAFYPGNPGYGRLGIIGASSLTINPPTSAPTVYAGPDLNTRLSQGAPLSVIAVGSITHMPVNWQVISGPTGASISTGVASFASVGTYQLRATASDGILVGSDDINIMVAPDLPSVSVTASIPTAVANVSSGQLTFSRTGAPTGSLIVNYSVSGTAVTGVSYVALAGSVTIPDQASSVTVPVVPTHLPVPGSTVTVTVTTSPSAYTIGLSSQATVTLQSGGPTFANWLITALPGFTAPMQLPTANPTHDGIPNLLKYAFHLDPTHAESLGLPVPGLATPGDGHDYLSIAFTQLQNAADITYTVQVSSDLVNWTSGSSATAMVSAIDNGNGTSTVTARDMTPFTSGHRFIRVQVSQ